MAGKQGKTDDGLVPSAAGDGSSARSTQEQAEEALAAGGGRSESDVLAEAGSSPLARPAIDTTVVGLGASAGGLEALEVFFANIPPDSGLAFVVITHQSPNRASLLPSLLARRTPMPVIEVDESLEIRPNHVYLAPPGRNMQLVNGRLHAMERDPSTRLSLPIDYFFRTLAQDQKERAIGIVLSGTGTDGTLGLKEIKAASGVSMVQDEHSARYSGMPHSAIVGDSPDFVLPVHAMPRQLLAYAEAAALSRSHSRVADEQERSQAMRQILLLLRGRTGHDFGAYKESTVRRRIERRMSIHHHETPIEYAKYLQSHPGELDVLFDELLIGVTSFFRDAAAFDSLASALLELLSSKPEGYAARVWVAGCSTGEEAYSLAILFRECLDKLNKPLHVQIFATDLDPKAIECARAGVYPIGIAGDVSASRLQRFFVTEGETCRVRKEIREMVVFATQNLVEDPPFTKLDLLSCRNLLIYLDSKLQSRLFPLFHYALKPGSLAFLGTSESVGSSSNLFEAVDKKWKIFRRREVAGGTYVAQIPATVSSETVLNDPGTLIAPRRSDVNLTQLAEKVLLRELVPPTVLIRERGDIVHIHGRTGKFLEPAPGPQLAVNIFNMAREGLQLELTAAVRQAAREDEAVRRNVRVKSGEHATISLDLRVRRLSAPEAFRGLFLVAFEPPSGVGVDAHGGQEVPSKQDVSRIEELERELQYTKESHQSTIEELETANEELKSTNEELQSTNEELQSANEELETSKEELQSLNEELQTVNAELHGKVEDLSRANDDMTNLLNATDIATIFLDNDLNIKRHTEQAKRIIRLIPSDVGRPIADLVSRLHYDRLVEDARDVLRTLAFKEAELHGEGDTWYLMRILPYRTTDNVIDGLVITFVDITHTKALQRSEERLVQALQKSPVTIFGQDRSLHFTWTCSAVFGLPGDGVLGKSDAEVLGEADARRLEELKLQVLASGRSRRQSVTLNLQGRARKYDVYVEPQRAASGEIEGCSCVMVDITDL